MRDTPDRRRLVILGSGFAALRLLKAIDRTRHDVAVVSRRNHFLFTPLLPSTAVGTVEFRSIVEPVRRRGNVEFYLAAADSLDPDARTVHCRGPDGGPSFALPYDVLAVCVGADTNTFGVPGAREHACVLKELADARVVRERVVANFERAALPGVDATERARLLHFVAIGAGPTGVRFAAELHDLLAVDVRRAFPGIAGEVKVTILDAGPAVLGAYAEPLRAYAERQLRALGTEIRLGCPVAEIGPGFVRLRSAETIPAGLIVWAAGFGPTPFVAGLPFARDRAGRLLTDEFLRVGGRDDLFALGDCARPDGRDLPQLAQVAEQQGAYLGRALNRRAVGRPIGPFTWRDRGASSFLGHGRAVVQRPGRPRGVAGFLAYQLWRMGVFTGLLGPKNRVLVPLDRLRAYVFGRDLSKF